MENYKNFFTGKKVLLMGLGLLGRGVGDARFLSPLCKDLVVTDLKNEAELAHSLTELKSFSNIAYHLGGHLEEDFIPSADGPDMIIKAAGVPLNSPYIAAARKAGVPVYMSTALFAKFAREAGAKLVGVTGTRGKSTTAGIIYHALNKTLKPSHLGGNIRGRSTLEMLPEVKEGDIVVLELDSWQLQGFGDLRLSPDIAVFTNLMSDHLNYYGGDTSTTLSAGMEKYFWDKANIFLHQKSGDKLFVGDQVRSRVQKINPPTLPLVPPPIPQDWHLKLLGEHNRQNAAFAASALRALGLSDVQIKAGLESFEPVEGRLQFVREVSRIKIYNDNNATTPDATIAALKSFTEPIILITGGADKDLPLDALVEQMKKCKKVLLLAGTGTDRIKPLLLHERYDISIYHTIEEVVRAARAVSVPGDIILFSPAFASFGLFKNEYDRNDQFLAAVKMLA